MDDASAPDKPAFQTSLKLTPEQLQKLLDFVRTQLDTCCKEMGRGKDGRTEPGSWLDRRRLNQLWYEGDLSWRGNDDTQQGTVYLGGVFADSNFTRGDGKRYVRHMAAKVTDDLIGTSPFFAAMKTPMGQEKPELIKAIEEIAQEGVENSNVPDTMREAVELALVRNEAVVKVRNVFEATGFTGPAKVLVGPDGQPVRSPQKALYIFENDDMVAVPGDQSGLMALAKDASFTCSQEQKSQFTYQQFDSLPQVSVRRKGLDARVLDPRDFITNLKGGDIHENQICAHYYDELPGVLKAVYGQFDVSNAYYCAPESGEKAPIASQGEQATIGTAQEWVPISETYVRFDADEDGLEEEILLIVNRDRFDAPLFYDYLANHMKKRPFEVVHGLRKVPARWYGVGIYTDKFDQLIFVDKTFNRINLKNSKTCTVTAVRRNAIEEWSDQKLPIVLGGDEVLTLNDKWNSKEDGDWLEQKRLIEVSEEETSLMRDGIQSMDLEFGLISAADASASGLNNSKTATGIASIERSGDTLVKAVERIHQTGITNILEQCVDITLENLDPSTISLTKDAEALTLNRDEIRDLPRDVTLLLTRARSTELTQTNQQAIQTSQQYFALLAQDPRQAKAVRPLYVSILTSLEVESADEMLPEVTDDEIKAFAQAQQQKNQPPKEVATIALKDIGPLAPDERAQALKLLGITASTPEQVAQAQAQTVRVEAAKRLQPAPQSSGNQPPPPTPPAVAAPAAPDEPENQAAA